MKLIEEILNSFKKNDVIYFGNDEESGIINVIYSGLNNADNRISIILTVNEDSNIVTFIFIKKIKDDTDKMEIMSKLLDLNSCIANGVLSMKTSSNNVQYKIDYFVNDDHFSFDKYNIYILACIMLYERLQEENII